MPDSRYGPFLVWQLVVVCLVYGLSFLLFFSPSSFPPPFFNLIIACSTLVSVLTSSIYVLFGFCLCSWRVFLLFCNFAEIIACFNFTFSTLTYEGHNRTATSRDIMSMGMPRAPLLRVEYTAKGSGAQSRSGVTNLHCQQIAECHELGEATITNSGFAQGSQAIIFVIKCIRLSFFQVLITSQFRQFLSQGIAPPTLHRTSVFVKLPTLNQPWQTTQIGTRASSRTRLQMI